MEKLYIFYHKTRLKKYSNFSTCYLMIKQKTTFVKAYCEANFKDVPQMVHKFKCKKLI